MNNLGRTLGAGTAAALASAALLMPLSSASAEDARFEVAQQAWFWNSNQQFNFKLKDQQLFKALLGEVPEQAPGASIDVVLADGGPKGLAPVPPGTLSPISYGHLGVSLINGSSEMRSFVKFDTWSIPEGAKIESFKMRLTISRMGVDHLSYHLDTESRPPSTFNDGFARIDACPVSEPWGVAEGAAPYAFEFQRPEVESRSTDINRKDQRNEPLYDCGKGRVRGTIEPSGEAMVWDLTSMAQMWANDPLSNEGVVLVGAAEGTVPTWVVEFHGAEYILEPAVFGLPVPLPVNPPELKDDEPITYVTKEDAGFATVSYSPPVIEPTPTPTTIIQPGTSQTIIQPGTNQTIIQPGQPGATVVVPFVPGEGGAAPVGDISTPGWVFLAFPIGLLGLGAVLGAVGKDDLAMASVPLAGSRVATMLRERRLSDHV